MTVVLLDTHVLLWWSSSPTRLSRAAARTIQAAEELAVADMTWYELAWMARSDRIAIPGSVGDWLGRLSEQVRTVPITPEIADSVASMPSSFPNDPADRIIVATAIEHRWKLVSKDERLREHPLTKGIVVW